MRAKDIWEAYPLPEKIRLLRSRVTSTKWSKTFCALALLHCILQIALQFAAYRNNRATGNSFEAVVMDATMVPQPFAILEKNGDLTLCADIPERFGGPDPCNTISFNEKKAKFSHAYHRRFVAEAKLRPNGTIEEVELTGLDDEPPNYESDVSPKCVQTFPWVYDFIHNAEREDLVFVLYQGWLLAISIFAIFRESVPHLATALASECLATIWSMYKLARTESFKIDFNRIVTNGSCDGINVLPHYFGFREALEAAIMVLNILALSGFTFVTWRLYQEYAPKMLKRVDSRTDMDHLYRITLSLATLIHLAAFFLLVVAGLFIDQLFFGRIRLLSKHVIAYEAVFLLLIVLIVPWLVTGIISLRKELRMGMIIFFLMSLGFLAIWGAMFASQIYRFMFSTWPFLATTSIFACLLLVTVLCLSAYAFLNFGLGLPEYLRTVTQPHPADKVEWMIEEGTGDLAAKSRDSVPVFVIPTEGLVPVSNDQPSRFSYASNGSRFSLTTAYGHQHPVIVEPQPLPTAQFRLAQPIASLPTLTPVVADMTPSVSGRRGSPKYPPGLTVPPRKPLPATPKMSQLQIPTSRWSASTVTTEAPGTPAPVSATGVQPSVPLHSRWSSSTTNTTITSSSGSRGSEIPPVPELPKSRLGSVVESARPLRITNPSE